MTQAEQTPKQVLEATLRDVAKGYGGKTSRGEAPTATERMRAALALEAIDDLQNVHTLTQIINGPSDKKD